MTSISMKRPGGDVDDLNPAKKLRHDELLSSSSSSSSPSPLSSLSTDPLFPNTAAAAAVAAAAAAAAASPNIPHIPGQLSSVGRPGGAVAAAPPSLNVAEKLDSITKQLDQSEASLKGFKVRQQGKKAGEDETKEGDGTALLTSPTMQPSTVKEDVEMKEGQADDAQPGAASSSPAPTDIKTEASTSLTSSSPLSGVPPLPTAAPAPTPTLPIIIPIPTSRIVCPHAGCTSKFTSEKGLQRHLSKHTVNPKPSPHVCDQCKASFATKANLKVHNRIHTGEKPFKCETCDKAFRQLSGLEGHKKIHSGEKPYGCEKCGRTFAQKGTLHQHILSHTGEKPHKCDICDRGFTQLSTLLQHKRTHTGARPFACVFPGCTKTYPQQTALNQHTRTHTKEKPFQCTWDDPLDPTKNCRKSFTCKANLKAHTRFHTGEKPYKCKECDSVFAQYTTLKYHEKTKHSALDPEQQAAAKQQRAAEKEKREEKQRELQAQQQAAAASAAAAQAAAGAQASSSPPASSSSSSSSSLLSGVPPPLPGEVRSEAPPLPRIEPNGGLGSASIGGVDMPSLPLTAPQLPSLNEGPAVTQPVIPTQLKETTAV